MSRVPGTTSRRVRTLYLVPSPATPGLTAAEQIALTVRRDATIAGRCACGATFPRIRVRHGRVTHAAMRHQADCPAASSIVEQLADRLGAAVEYEPVVVELEVAA